MQELNEKEIKDLILNAIPDEYIVNGYKGKDLNEIVAFENYKDKGFIIHNLENISNFPSEESQLEYYAKLIRTDGKESGHFQRKDMQEKLIVASNENDLNEVYNYALKMEKFEHSLNNKLHEFKEQNFKDIQKIKPNFNSNEPLILTPKQLGDLKESFVKSGDIALDKDIMLTNLKRENDNKFDKKENKDLHKTHKDPAFKLVEFKTKELKQEKAQAMLR